MLGLRRRGLYATDRAGAGAGVLKEGKTAEEIAWIIRAAL